MLLFFPDCIGLLLGESISTDVCSVAMSAELRAIRSVSGGLINANSLYVLSCHTFSTVSALSLFRAEQLALRGLVSLGRS